MRHPEEERLLRYADGELPALEIGEIRSHLQACWQCRTELDELQKVVGECVRYRKDMLETCLPPPPAPWGDIRRQFAKVDATLEHPAFLTRIAEALRFPIRHTKSWVPAAVALALIGGLFHQFRNAPSVQAAELLRKAVTMAEPHSGKPRRIQIRTRKQRVTRQIGSDRQPATSETGDLSQIEALFQSAHYSWEDPLSARSYQAWRDQLSDKRDEVTTISDQRTPGTEYYRIRTTSTSSELQEATLKLAVRDLRPVEGTLQFRNQEWVEITELPDETNPASGMISAAAPTPRAPAPPAPKTGAHEDTVASATLGQELQVLAALHRVGADLGEPIQVSRAGGRILVAGVGIATERRQEIQNALGSMPHVAVRFSEPDAEAARPGGPAPGEPTVNPEVSRLQARLEKHAGDRASFERFTAQTLDRNEAMMSRAYALKRLAERFSPQVEAELSAGDRQLLRTLVREHSLALTREAVEIERLSLPVFGPASEPDAGGARNALSAGPWQLATEDLFRAARRVESLLAAAIGGAPTAIPVEDLPTQLLSGLARLRAAAEAYGGLTKPEAAELAR